MQPPPTSYAERDGIAIAYQVVGDGPVDLVISPGFISHLDLQWTEPRFAHFLGRLAGFCRLILYDKPGTGLSDPIAQLPTLEERVADLEAVLDAARSARTVVLGISEGGPTAVLLAAMRPERVTSLILYGTCARFTGDDLSPEAARRMEKWAAEFDYALSHWGDGAALRIFAPSMTGEVARQFYGTFARAAASPRMARALIDSLGSIDVRGVLDTIQAPTMVMHVTGDRAVPVEAGRELAAGIPGSRFVELPGVDHAFWLGDGDPVIDEMERFVTGAPVMRVPERVLGTVVFTDIVGSTERATALGDRDWRELLARHDALADAIVAEHGGRVVKHLGDGLLALFPGGPAAAVRAAAALTERAPALGLEVRAGVHTGECETVDDDVGGVAVHVGARVAALAGPGEVLASRTVKDLVLGSGLAFHDRGEHALKGVPGAWQLFALDGHGTAPAPAVLDGTAAHMRRRDRIAVTLARRAPRAMRAGMRAATPRRQG